jgi:hypothetical protein
MPKGIYPRTKEHKRKIGLSNKGKIISEEHKRKISLSQFKRKIKFGYINSPKTRKKISLIHKKLWQNPKYRKKMSLNHKGMIGKHHTKETKKKISETHKNEKHYNWKGNKAKYGALHIWIKKNKPKFKFCEKCKKERKLALANIKNHNYTRNPNDYKWLCYSCHKKIDLNNKLN